MKIGDRVKMTSVRRKPVGTVVEIYTEEQIVNGEKIVKTYYGISKKSDYILAEDDLELIAEINQMRITNLQILILRELLQREIDRLVTNGMHLRDKELDMHNKKIDALVVFYKELNNEYYKQYKAMNYLNLLEDPLPKIVN